MSRPKNPSEKKGPRKRSERANREEHERTIPGSRRTPEYEKQHARILNEDEQNKVVNRREDNAQDSEETYDHHEETYSRDDNSHDRPSENQNDRLEAGDDNSEVNPRPRKVT